MTVHTVELGRPELSAARRSCPASIAAQLEKRVCSARLKGGAADHARPGAIGVKVTSPGGLGSAEMSRRESIIQGSIKLATLDADIDYGFAQAFTSYGAIGCKCWIFKGWYQERLKKEEDDHAADA